MSTHNQPAVVRIVNTRDSATSILRKLGVKPRDYNFFISKRDNGQLEVAVEAAWAARAASCDPAWAAAWAAQAHLQALSLPSTPAPKVEPKTAPDAKGEKKVSCSAVARDLILAGKTNDEVWVVIAEQFKLDQKKRGYPAWYRFQLRKTGHAV